MESPKSSSYVTGERGGTGDGRGWRWRMDVLAAVLIVAAVLPAAFTTAGANVSPNAPQSRHASQVCTKVAPG